MKTARFTIKLIDESIQTYQTTGLSKLVSKATLSLLWQLGRDNPEGAYFNKFPDDLAISHTRLTDVSDGDGRKFRENDTIIFKLDSSDSAEILDLYDKTFHLSNQLNQAHSTFKPEHPLPEPDVKLP